MIVRQKISIDGIVDHALSDKDYIVTRTENGICKYSREYYYVPKSPDEDLYVLKGDHAIKT